MMKARKGLRGLGLICYKIFTRQRAPQARVILEMVNRFDLLFMRLCADNRYK